MFVWMMILTILVLVTFMGSIKIQTYETVEEFFIMDKGTKTYSRVMDYYCSDGVDVMKYTSPLSPNKVVFYGCLNLVGDFPITKCSGEGKQCFVKYKRLKS